MKSYRKELWFNLPTRRGFVNITPQVAAVLQESGVKEGLVLVNAMYITASVFINDDESGLHQDYERWLEQLAPHEPVSHYRHNDTGEDNADAHLKRQVMGREVVVAITGGKLDFGPWEQIFYGEFDGRRRKRVLVNAMHITASVFINDDESGLHQDYERWLEQLAPHEPVSQYRHNDTGEDNADAHIKRQVMGREVVVAITGGKLDFGPWEQIFYGEFDGRRRKRVLVKIIGE